MRITNVLYIFLLRFFALDPLLYAETAGVNEGEEKRNPFIYQGFLLCFFLAGGGFASSNFDS